jgi:rRNA maturation RNase YbeY
LSLRIFYDDGAPALRNWRLKKKKLEKVILGEGKIPGDLNFILTSDTELRKINKQFLKHNYFTDVISFAYSSGEVLNGEIYISFQRIRKNAIRFRTKVEEELLRVMIHGILHICGYEDANEGQRKEMRSIEDKWLMIFREK